MKIHFGSLLFLVGFAFVPRGAAQLPPASPTTPAAQIESGAPLSPSDLPGKGLAEHNFLYAGESHQRRMFLVKDGQVVWSYDDPAGKGEISDAVMLANGNVLFAHQYAVELITPAKEVLWKYDAPPGTEVHTAQPIGLDRVLFVQNGDPALVKVMNIRDGKTEREWPLAVKNPPSTHGQFRHVRLTAEGTLLVAHMDLGKVSEYDADGHELSSFPAPGVWGVTPLADGHRLVAGSQGVRETTRQGETVWSLRPSDVPDYHLDHVQLAWRLANGNTLINTWMNEWSKPVDRSNLPVQAIEVTPDKKVVWALRSWTDPTDLGPSTTIQLLDQSSPAPEAMPFGQAR